MRVSWLIVATVAGVLLAGCSEEPPDPVGEPTTSSTSPSHPTPTTAGPSDIPTEAPPLPEAATKPTRAGARAFIHHYIDLLNYAALTGDVRDFRAAAHDCGGCDDYVRLYRSLYAKGGWIKGREWRITTLSLTCERDIRCTAHVKVRAATGLGRKDQNSKPKPMEPATYRIVLRTKFEPSPRVTDFEPAEVKQWS